MHHFGKECEVFKRYRNIVQYECSIAKKCYYTNKVAALKSTNIKWWWSEIKSLQGGRVYLQTCLEAFNLGPQLRQWITVLHSNISSCVLNNGFATKHFNLSRGVRQGCPLSGILFVIGVEILSNAIKRSKEIEGIQIDPNKPIKITQYADDTTVFVKAIRSVHRLFDLLQQFENCSGLRINQSKSEILWPGSLRQRKDSILKLN